MILLLACTGYSPPGETGETGFELDDTETAKHTEETETAVEETETDSGQESETEETDTGTAQEDWATGVSLVGTDTEAWRGTGYVVSTFEIGPDYWRPMTTPDGGNPRFLVVWPEPDAAKTNLLPIVLLHDGVLGLQRGYGADNCTSTAAEANARLDVEGSGLAGLVTRSDAVLIVPLNPWCDGWVGLGEEDPANQDQFGALLVEAAANYVRLGQEDIPINTRSIAAVGIGDGANGAVYYATREPGVQGVVVDSGFTDPVRLYQEADYSPIPLTDRQDILDHVLGGPPYESDGVTESAAYARYGSWGLVQNVEGRLFTVPVFHLWNDADPTSPAIQHQDAAEVLARAYGRDGIRFLEWNVSHPTPDHVQLRDYGVLYAGVAAIEHLRQRTVLVVEAESFNTSTVGEPVHARANTQTFSGDGGWIATPDDGPGTLLTVDIGKVPERQVVNVAFFVTVDGATDVDAAAGTVRLFEDGNEVRALEFTQRVQDWNTSSFDARFAAYQATALEVSSNGGLFTASVETNGTASVTVDVAVASY